MMKWTPSADKDERGSALLIVLWLLVLVSAIAVSMSGTSRVESRLAFNLAEEARARYLAQAGVNHAILTLLNPQARRRKVMDGSVVRTLDLFGATVTVALRDECGKVDLNTAWGGLIKGLLRGGGEGGAQDSAQDQAQAILDWRDPDTERRPGGAEDKDYAEAGLPYGARDGLFETIEELQQVRGISQALYLRLAPDITVDCLAAGIDPLAASPAVLAAIPGIDQGSLAAFLRARQAAAMRDDEVAVPPELLGGKYVEPSLGDVISIESRVELPSGTRVAWQAVVWRTGDQARGYVVRSWRRVASPAADDGDS